MRKYYTLRFVVRYTAGHASKEHEVVYIGDKKPSIKQAETHLNTTSLLGQFREYDEGAKAEVLEVLTVNRGPIVFTNAK